MSLDKIKETARIVRSQCESYAASTGHDEYGKDLSCMCGIASYALREAIKRIGIRIKLIYGFYGNSSGHCWLNIEDKIIDITATQFGVSRKVFVTSISNAKYDRLKEMKSMSEIKIDGWGDHSPTRLKVYKILGTCTE